jgi:hypothetical protein
MRHYFTENEKEVKILKGLEDPFKRAEGMSGWVLLHDDELDILKALMETLNEPNVYEYDVRIVKGTESKKFYRLHVKDLSMAYRIIDIARKVRMYERIAKCKQKLGNSER